MIVHLSSTIQKKVIINALDDLINRREASEYNPDPHLDDIKNFYDKEYALPKPKTILDDEDVMYGLSEQSRKELAKMTRRPLFKYVVLDYMELAKYYLYVAKHLYYDYKEEELEVLFESCSTLIDSIKPCFRRISHEDYGHVLSLLLELADEEPYFSSNKGMLTPDQKQRILSFLQSDFLSSEYIERFLSEFESIPIYIEQNQELTNDTYKSTVADTIRKILELSKKGPILEIVFALKQERFLLDAQIEKNKAKRELIKKEIIAAGGDIGDIEEIVKGTDTILSKALSFKYDEMSFKSIINYALGDKHQAKSREKRKVISMVTLDDDSNTVPNKVRRVIEIISDYYLGKNSKREEYYNQKRRTIKCYSDAKETIEKIADNQIITEDMAKSMIKGIVNNAVIRKIMEWIRLHNEEILNDKNEEYNRLSSDNENNIIALFKKHNIPIDKTILSIVSSIPYEELSSMIKTLSNAKFEPNAIVNIILISDKTTIASVCKYIELGFLEKDFILRNIDIFRPGNELLKKYQSFQRFLRDHQFNPQTFTNSVEQLINDIETAKKNILYLEKCGLVPALKKTDKTLHSLLIDPNMCDKVDKIIECGCYDSLKGELSLLALPMSRLKRIDVMTSMNFPLSMDDEEFNIKDFLTRKFFVTDVDLDRFIIEPTIDDSEKVWNPSKESLERFRLTNDSPVLQIGDITISYPKIERKMAEGLSFVEALFYNRCLDDGTYQEMLEEIKPFVKEKH